jgi:hypothetical protein
MDPIVEITDNRRIIWIENMTDDSDRSCMTSISDTERASRLKNVVAKLNECLAELDILDGFGMAGAELDHVIVRLGGQPTPPPNI